MDATEISLARETAGDVDAAVARVSAELAARGFGVLATLRVHEILREKTGTEIAPVVILDVCSPRHALAALQRRRDAALLLPCKIVVSREGRVTRITLQRPTVALARLLPAPELGDVGAETERILTEAVVAACRTGRDPAAPPTPRSGSAAPGGHGRRH